MSMQTALRKAGATAAAWVPDALMIGGATAVSCGLGLVYLPAGIVVGGVFALVAGWLLARGA